MLARSSDSPLGADSNHASRISSNSASEVARRLRASTLASFHLRAPAAVAASPHRAARIPGTLLAAIEAPVPVQQATIACSARPSATSRAALSPAPPAAASRRLARPRPVVALGVAVGAVEDRVMAPAAQLLGQDPGDPGQLIGGD